MAFKTPFLLQELSQPFLNPQFDPQFGLQTIGFRVERPKRNNSEYSAEKESFTIFEFSFHLRLFKIHNNKLKLKSISTVIKLIIPLSLHIYPLEIKMF